MSDTPTPRTDSLMEEWHHCPPTKQLLNHSRQLERELAEAKANYALAHSELGSYVVLLAEMTKFRDLLANKEMELLKQLTAHKAALEKCEKALTRISNREDAPPIDATGQIQFGLHCGVEDRRLSSRYEGADYGYQCGAERALDWAIQETTEALAEIARLKGNQ